MACSDTSDSKDRLFLSIKAQASTSDFYDVSVESYVVSFILCYCEINCLDIFFVEDFGLGNTIPLSKDAQCKLNAKVIDRQFLSQEIQDCRLPAIQSSDSLTCAGGLCAVLRWALKSQVQREPAHSCKDILGFRGGCLSACSEVSIWTKFCEVDFPGSVKAVIYVNPESFTEESVTLPEHLVRFECHLKVPVRTHNVLKRKQDIVKKHRDQQQDLDEFFGDLSLNGMKKDCTDLQLKHAFAEGIDKTLSDLMLWPCVHFHIKYLEKHGLVINDILPHVWKWFERLSSDPKVMETWQLLTNSEVSEVASKSVQKNLIFPVVAEESLYSRDPKRNKTKVRHHDPGPIIEKLKSSGIEAELEPCPSGMEEGMDWHSLPLSVHPAGGDLPLSRVERKCQQVESMVLAVLELAVPGDRIVDFCSGGGHVGLLLAYYLPKCQIILIENKEASLERARIRAQDLELDNVIFYQCNLDYFQGTFSLGVSLHACGVATDLVIEKCLSNRASFVCCPCCYGSIREVASVKYPKSYIFAQAGITPAEYLQLCHCADRTEIDTPKEYQGKQCMAIVDHDRCAHIREQNYSVTLCTLQPPDCTPKSNVIIAIPLK